MIEVAKLSGGSGVDAFGLGAVGEAVDADVDDGRAGLMKSAVTNAGRPMAATRMSACAAHLGEVAWSCEWQMVTVALSCSSRSAMGLPTMSLRPMTTAFLPAMGIR